MWRSALLWSALATSAASVMYFAVAYWRALDANNMVRALNSGQDIDVNIARAPDRLLLARINELLRRDRFDEAQGIANAAAPRMADQHRAQTLYNLANDRVRRATALISKGDIDGATALVNVAKSEYRLALRQSPDVWDVKYNLDVAMRMVRDLPSGDNEPEEVPPDAPKRVWTDLPGVPKGLP
ncbi:MAG: hypothetical protein CTY31_04100 [Hyphomicrobium sp.]|nr:MAG: hypothetical protein CTY31_04100 [Hyphomicrobium sp.]